VKRFHFPLRPLAKLRAHLELNAREAFGASVRAHAAAQEQLVRAGERVSHLEGLVIAGRQGSFSAAGEAQNLGAYRGELALESAAASARVEAAKAMERRRAEYIEAHRRLEVVERLEEKARTAHRLAMNREEQAEFDDLASRRAARKSTFVP
jgi:flagellar FliJ protein